MSADARFLVVGTKPWNRRVFDDRLANQPGDWSYAGNADALADALAAGPYRYVFFLHWSHIVPDDVLEAHECVCFHMTDVPYGRGGSPLQNLIVRGHTTTRLTALRMTTEVDGGPVYLKRDLALCGTAEEIYARASELSAEMIVELVASDPDPTPQVGEVVAFARRRPAASALPDGLDLGQVHDFIRMLDADGYPAAFIETQGLRFEFRRSARYADRVEADVRISLIEPSAP